LDILSIVGIVMALVAIVGGNLLEGGHVSSLLQLTAFVIVFGGTSGAILIQSPISTFLRALRMAAWVILPPKIETAEAIGKIVNWSNIARKEGLLGLESLAENEPEPFARKGLQLLVDGSEPQTIRAIMEVELGAREYEEVHAAKVFEGMGGYSPTIGIIGAVMGLIHVMNNLADPSKLGAGIAVAFVATIYGVGLANLFFLPMANKLKSIVHLRTQFREMVIEGIVSIAEGENPRNIETKLRGFIG
jgi:chemotaxis protein MotA